MTDKTYTLLRMYPYEGYDIEKEGVSLNEIKNYFDKVISCSKEELIDTVEIIEGTKLSRDEIKKLVMRSS